MVICLGRGADLHVPADDTATHCLLLQQNPDWFCPSGIRAHLGSPGQRAVKRVSLLYLDPTYTGASVPKSRSQITTHRVRPTTQLAQSTLLLRLVTLVSCNRSCHALCPAPFKPRLPYSYLAKSRPQSGCLAVTSSPPDSALTR